MAEFKIVISDPKTGRSYQQELKDDVAKRFLGLKIGDTVKGELLDLTGYEFQITGGSDHCGFPMRRDVPGAVRRKILAVQGTGVKRKKRTSKKKIKQKFMGVRQRKTVVGDTIQVLTAQINLKVTKYGKKSLGLEESKGVEEKKETKEKPEEKVEQKEEIKKKPEEKAEQKTDVKEEGKKKTKEGKKEEVKEATEKDKK